MCFFTCKGYVTFQYQECKSAETRYGPVHFMEDIALIDKTD